MNFNLNLTSNTLNDDDDASYNNNNSNMEIEKLKIVICCLMSASLSFDSICLLTIAKSRAKLIKTEFFILLAAQTYALAYKSFSLLISLAILAAVYLFGSSTCIYLYPGLFTASTTFNTILVYYSLLHASALRSSRIEHKLFVAVREPANFLIFLAITSLSILGGMLAFFLKFRDRMLDDDDNNHTACHLEILGSATIVAVCLSNAPLIPVIAVYLLSIVRIVWSGGGGGGGASRGGARRVSTSFGGGDHLASLKHQRKILRISLKFLSFTLIPTLGFVCRLAVPISALVCTTTTITAAPVRCSAHSSIFITKTLHLLIFATFSLEPLVLTYIHNILFATFLEHFVRPCVLFFARPRTQPPLPPSRQNNILADKHIDEDESSRHGDEK